MSRRGESWPLPADYDDSIRAAQHEVRSAVLRFLLVGLFALVAISVPVALWIQARAQSQAVGHATELTQLIADNTVGPIVTAELLAGDAEALERLDTRLEPWLKNGSIVRVKVWNTSGTIVYSDAPAIIGQTFPLPPWTAALFADGVSQVSFEEQQDADSELESGLGPLIEIYLRTHAATGAPLMFEAYFDDEAVTTEHASLLLDLTPVILLALATLQLAQLPPAIKLARTIQRNRIARRRLLQHAIHASDLERKRIARCLHDDVIQDLAALSYSLEAEAMHGSTEHRLLLGTSGAILQQNLRALRDVTGDLYPPDLDRVEFLAALRHVAERLVARGIDVRIEASEIPDLDSDRAVILYRVAREALTNASKHARAQHVVVLLHEDAGLIRLTVRDDGCGFDPAATAPDGHVGLRIMRDASNVSGGNLAVESRLGEGTTIVLTLSRG